MVDNNDDLDVDQEFLTAIQNGNVQRLSELLSSTRRGRRGITDDFLFDLLSYFFQQQQSNEASFHAQVCHLLCSSLSPHLIRDIQSGSRDSHLFAAVKYGRVDAVKFLVNNYSHVFSIHQLYHGRPLLYHAAMVRFHSLQASRDMCGFLIAKGANVNQLDNVGWTTLNHIVRINNADLAQLLLVDCHADPTIVAHGQTEQNVDHAIFRGNGRILALLLSHGAVLENFVILVGVLSLGIYPMVNQVQQENTRQMKCEICRALANHLNHHWQEQEKNSNTKHKHKHNNTNTADSTTFETVQVALECIIYLGYNEILEICFESGNLKPTFRSLYCAIEFGNVPAARFLVQYGIDPFALEPYEYDVLADHDTRAASPFHAAARQDETRILKYFVHLWYEQRNITAGSPDDDVEQRRGGDDHPIHVLCRDGNISIHAIKVLVEGEYNANISQPDRHGILPLQSAILSNASIDVIYYLSSRFPGALWWWSSQLPSSARLPVKQQQKQNNNTGIIESSIGNGKNAALSQLEQEDNDEAQHDSSSDDDSPPNKKLKTLTSAC